jgi:hypothetical protein
MTQFSIELQLLSIVTLGGVDGYLPRSNLRQLHDLGILSSVALTLSKHLRDLFPQGSLVCMPLLLFRTSYNLSRPNYPSSQQSTTVNVKPNRLIGALAKVPWVHFGGLPSVEIFCFTIADSALGRFWCGSRFAESTLPSFSGLFYFKSN